MSNQSDVFPFACPNPKCTYQFTEFPARDQDNAIRCPVCGDRFRPRVEFSGREAHNDLYKQIGDGIVDDIKRQIGDKSS